MSDYTTIPDRYTSLRECVMFMYVVITQGGPLGVAVLFLLVAYDVTLGIKQQYNRTAEYRGVEPI